MSNLPGRREGSTVRAPRGIGEGAVAYVVTVAGEQLVRWLARPSDWEAMRDAGTPYHLVIDDTTGLPSWAVGGEGAVPTPGPAGSLLASDGTNWIAARIVTDAVTGNVIVDAVTGDVILVPA